VIEPGMAPALVAAFAVGLVVAIGLFLVIVTYNEVVALERRIEKAWANIEVVLQQRHDQLPLLVDAVRGLMAYERDILVEVTRARSGYRPSDPIPAQAAAAAETTRAVKDLLFTVEHYPAIKSAENVADLQDEIERLEAMIADRRELYNDQVYRFNTRIRQLPALLLAGLFGWSARPFFDAGPSAEARPTVDLGPGRDDRPTS
jgi:LemA protein